MKPKQNNKNHPDVCILGAGIMGCCLSLELAQRGYRVDLIDLASSPMTGASLHNEGKLHLGFVYANDPSKETHSLMIRGSLSFCRIIKKLTGHNVNELYPSQPFHYYIPIDSQLDLDAINNHFSDVEEAIHKITLKTGDHFLGRRHERYFEKNPSETHARIFSPSLTLGSFKTEECSVSTVALANILIEAVKKQTNIFFIGDTKVISASKLAGGDVQIELIKGQKSFVKTYDCVANCLWDDKLRIDRTAGVRDDSPCILRYKATISVSAPTVRKDSIPSATGILGSYGDVVNHDNGMYYISWYPLCKLAQSVDDDGRRLHEMVHKCPVSRNIKKALSNYPSISSFVSSITHRGFIKDNIREMAKYIPSVANLLNSENHYKLGGGVILARGSTDIDDPNSYLHKRSEVGPVAHGSYITIDTGKYCTAPLFSLEAADMITGILS